MKKTIICVFGTRPEAIKLCPLIQELEKRGRFNVTVCVTGQHKEMLSQVLDAFGIIPQYDLAIMKSEQTLFDITTNILEKIRGILEVVKPEMAIVQGDTSTTFATSLACFYLKIPVAHVEAGLRTNNIYSPFPEEFNRHAVSILSTLDFAPTERAKDNLMKEGKSGVNIYVTGNTAIDALRTTLSKNYSSRDLEWCEGRKLILITAHRRENIGEPMRNMFSAIRRVLKEHEDICAIYPIHKNPAVRAIAEDAFANEKNVRLIEPLDVIDFHNYMSRSYLILTDSGGIQEEAPSLGIPVLVMRDTTERPEGVECGTLKLSGTSEDGVYNSLCELLSDEGLYRRMSASKNPYGDGHASERIANILEQFMDVM